MTLPYGVQDYLPDECYHKNLAERRICNTFSSFGYERIETPALEYSDLYAGVVPMERMFKLTDNDGGLLVLRPDTTLQVCRMAAKMRFSGVKKLYYTENSFEYLPNVYTSRTREFAQAGVELLGESGADGDVEVITLAIEAFLSTGLKDFLIEIGDVRFFKCIMRGCGLDEADARLKVRMFYAIRNDEASQLGRSPLPAGKVRIFISDPPPKVKAVARKTFLGEDEVDRTLRNETMRLSVGLAQDILVRRFVEKNDSAHVTGNLYDKTVSVRYEIENYKETPVELQILENLEALEGYNRNTKRPDWRDGLKTAWELAPDSELGAPDPEHSTADKALFRVQLPAREKDGQPVKIVKRLRVRFPGQYVED